MRKAYKEVEFIDETSQRFDFGKKVKENDKEQTKKNKSSDSDNGFCIRTRLPIPFDIEKPYRSFINPWKKDRGVRLIGLFFGRIQLFYFLSKIEIQSLFIPLSRKHAAPLTVEANSDYLKGDKK